MDDSGLYTPLERANSDTEEEYAQNTEFSYDEKESFVAASQVTPQVTKLKQPIQNESGNLELVLENEKS